MLTSSKLNYQFRTWLGAAASALPAAGSKRGGGGGVQPVGRDPISSDPTWDLLDAGPGTS